MFTFLLLLSCIATSVTAVPSWVIDPTWPSEKTLSIFKGGFFSAVTLDYVNDIVYVAQRNVSCPGPIVALSRVSGDYLYSWGSEIVANVSDQWGIHGMYMAVESNQLWFTDVAAHVVRVVIPPARSGTKATVERTFGTPGRAGSNTDPLQFGNVADVATTASQVVVISDGDGGVNNRVVAFATWRAAAPMWVTPNTFSSPHSVAAVGNDVLVADRGHNRTVLLSRSSGTLLDEWTCKPGTPWGLRALPLQRVLFVSDGDEHTVSVMSLRGLSHTSLGPCEVLQTVAIPPQRCSRPHEMGTDELRNTVYLACVDAPESSLLRLIPATD